MKMLWPVPVSDRISFIYVERARCDQDGHALVARRGDEDLVLPVGKTSILMLGPGCSISHAAMRVCADEGVLILWVGEQGVRLYACSNPRSNAEALLRQATIRLDPRKRLLAAREIWRRMFNAEPAQNRSIDQLRGAEGARVKALLPELAKIHGLEWIRRDGSAKDPLNQAINTATSTLYGLCEAVILALGYSPAIGMIHDGDPRSFVFDVADTIKFQTVVPLAMKAVRMNCSDIGSRVRRECRDLFYREKLAERLVGIITGIVDAAHRA